MDILNDPKVDLVAIATPVDSHYPLAKAALEAGKHVLVEKPMTASVEHAKELIALAAQKSYYWRRIMCWFIPMKPSTCAI